MNRLGCLLRAHYAASRLRQRCHVLQRRRAQRLDLILRRSLYRSSGLRAGPGDRNRAVPWRLGGCRRNRRVAFTGRRLGWRGCGGRCVGRFYCCSGRLLRGISRGTRQGWIVRRLIGAGLGHGLGSWFRRRERKAGISRPLVCRLNELRAGIPLRTGGEVIRSLRRYNVFCCDPCLGLRNRRRRGFLCICRMRARHLIQPLRRHCGGDIARPCRFLRHHPLA